MKQEFNKAVEKFQAGQIKPAEKILLKINKHQAGIPDVLHMLAYIAMETDRPKTAVKYLSQAIKIIPNDSGLLNLLGCAHLRVGRASEAIAVFSKVVSLAPELVDVHFNLATALQDVGRIKEAEVEFRRITALTPDDAEAHRNLGNVLFNLGLFNEAVVSYRKVLTIKSDDADVHNQLGIALYELGQLEDAVASFNKAIAIKVDPPGVHNNLGCALQEMGKIEEAITNFHLALAIKPDNPEASSNLGNALQELGRMDEAFMYRRRAVALNPQNALFWGGLATSVENLSFNAIDDNLLQDLWQLLEKPTVRPSYLIQPILSALRHHPDFSQIIEFTSSWEPDIQISYGDLAKRLSSIPLFIRVMKLSPINDLQIERMLTVLRLAMIKETLAGKNDERCLPFSTALALQCFTNEYAFYETDEEKAYVENLQQQIKTLVEEGRDIPPSFIASLGAYRPLNSYPWARELCEREWDLYIKEVIERQLTEPQEEKSLRDKITRLTPIKNTVSQLVREQYERNPYPRWIKTGIEGKGRSIGTLLQGAPLRLVLGDYQSPKNPEILIAGCGTGQHAILTASRLLNVRLLAVDLSLSCLSYALRKTKELKITNIEYAQGDILELGCLKRQFDLIESVGVLHHLGDPLVGWRVLVDLLKPGGLMKIALYSETARLGFTKGRSFIAEKGYGTSSEDIRRCRQDIIAMANDGVREMAEICSQKDFFSLSDCRDLLFHVQEHLFNLPQIEEALTALNLKFLGFEMRNQSVLRKFRKTYPGKSALTSLPQWHKFELKNPETFRGMYQFWCKKM